MHKNNKTNNEKYIKLLYLILLLLFVYSLLIYNDFTKKTSLVHVFISRIIDGDTIEIDTGEQIRYIGIDTPEIGQKYADEATRRNTDLLRDASVLLERDVLYKDKYNRILGYVWVDGMMVNDELVKEGLAKTLTIPPDTKYEYRFNASQEYAKIHKRGLWKGLQ
ncbi:hypothetical protein COT79_02835 [Candidatus Berkelbacteria bacterium CG10_big_fil_rev_8_21_14_0_10_43_14]|uniref:TNase-like domain-containing protein n=1 Tax=Candidatus Berkelbacteria bacterium CG10_big_fil_rev_8_21_14_0_10_43_14 TaxID=1974515 RepID=A0A2M6R8C0_9BACT|nr:MAG: hypothetical protein COT79_02835 [Candidatus Berkelbacteria bacterium CG10_big_fil_rev_8_21_14_0_10_43_14]